jgi:hypothetical protein
MFLRRFLLLSLFMCASKNHQRNFCFLCFLVFLPLFMCAFPIHAQTQIDWPMVGANPQRTSHNSIEVPGNLKIDWYRVFDPYIDTKVQVIAAGGNIYISSSKGLYAFDAATGNQLWVFGTELPPGNSPTYANGVVYLPGFDHRIRAINAMTGIEISGYIPYETGAGFETNPLVVNNVIYAGNRDGNIYALNATTGAKIWQYTTGGPIRFSAAISKDNTTVYFASDDSYAYALNANPTNSNDPTTILKWKSLKLPGAGFATYWPVVWTDTYPESPTFNQEYVIFSASEKGSTYNWFGTDTDFHQQNYDIGASCTATSGISYLWGSTTQELDCNPIYNYFNTTRPDRRNFIVLNAQSGTEFTPYAPVNWTSAPQAGNKFPPVVGNDGVLYSTIGYNTGGNGGASGWIAGTKFGTQYISKIWNDSGAADEPVAYSSGGNLIYWGAAFNHEAWGTIDLTKPAGSNYYSWNLPVNSSRFCSDPQVDQMLSWRFGPCTSQTSLNSNGVYIVYDGTNDQTPIPYNGKLYLIVANSLYALSPTGKQQQLALVTSPSNLSPANITLTKANVIQLLISELQKIKSAGHLRPGYYDSGYVGVSLDENYGSQTSIPLKSIIAGDHLAQYFHSPGDTLHTLALALPYLTDPTLKTDILNYLKTEEANYPVETYAHIGWKNGSSRETFTDTPEIAAITANGGANGEVPASPLTQIHYSNPCCTAFINIGSFPPEAFYAAWKYALAESFTPIQAKALFDSMKSQLQVPGIGNDMGFLNTSDTNSNLVWWPYILNRYIAGYRGYLELEKLAGYTTNITQSTQMSMYNNLVQLRLNTFSKDQPWGNIIKPGDYYNPNHVLNIARNFMYLTPELAEALNSNKFIQVQQALDEYQYLEPFWFVPKYERTYEEGQGHPLYDRWALFQARAYILKQPFSELVKYLDVPAFQTGDLYYIQNLVAALEAPTSTTNDYRAYLNFLPTFNLTTNIFDLNILLKNLFR